MSPEQTEQIDWRRRAARRSMLPLLVAVAGFVVVLVGKDDVLGIIGWAIVGAAVAIAIALVFLEVGYSEDRERAAEDSARGQADDGGATGAVDPDARDRSAGR